MQFQKKNMKKTGAAIAWGLNRFVKVFGNILSLIIRCFTRVRKGRVMCWAHNFKQYGCNPRYLTEYLLENNPEFEIFWVFRRKVDISGIDKRIRCVRFRSLEYYKLVNTAEFLITNSRTDPYRMYWTKRPEQKYLMLWHGGVALKKIEMDAEDKLGYSYVRKAKIDSRVCDLMISGCRFQTRLLKESFWYSGEILEKGIPRCDIFFDTGRHQEMNGRIRSHFSIPAENKIILYAPTFRADRSIEPYRINWDKVIPELRKAMNQEGITVLVRLHPNLLDKADTSSLVCYENVIDATRYHDMQELLCISDMLITDYSSSMFDISMLNRPCLLYATDKEKYDRGYYFRFDELPFPLAQNEEELIDTIKVFNQEKYDRNLKKFFDKEIGLFENGTSSRSLSEWMVNRRIS